MIQVNIPTVAAPVRLTAPDGLWLLIARGGQGMAAALLQPAVLALENGTAFSRRSSPTCAVYLECNWCTRPGCWRYGRRGSYGVELAGPLFYQCSRCYVVPLGEKTTLSHVVTVASRHTPETLFSLCSKGFSLFCSCILLSCYVDLIDS